MKLLCMFFICLLQMNVGWTQFDKTYVPVPILDTIPKEIYEQLKLRLESDKARITETRSQVKSYIKSLYDQRFEAVVRNFNKDYFIIDDEVTPYLQRIQSIIYDANPHLPRETKIYAYRSNTPNAVSFGDGTIGFTLGLLSKMESEAQVAFVICHELAHYHMKHSDLQIAQLTQLNFDKEYQKEIRNIKSSEYGRYTKLKNLFTNIGTSINKHSRGHEFEADSIGLLYYINTHYDSRAPIRTMEILDSADYSNYPENIDFKGLLDFKQFPFKQSWIEYTKSTTWYAPRENTESDTARTHPSCKKRIIALERQLLKSNRPYHNEQLKNDRTSIIKAKSEFELIASDFHFKAFGKALFKSMVMVLHYPDNAYLHAMIGRSFYQLYLYQKNHMLGKVLALPDPRFDENYDRFLTFVHKLRLTELSSLAYYYMISQKEEFFSNEEYLYSLWLCSNLEISKVDAVKVRSDYQARYPTGKYLNLMK